MLWFNTALLVLVIATRWLKKSVVGQWVLAVCYTLLLGTAFLFEESKGWRTVLVVVSALAAGAGALSALARRRRRTLQVGTNQASSAKFD